MYKHLFSLILVLNICPSINSLAAVCGAQGKESDPPRIVSSGKINLVSGSVKSIPLQLSGGKDTCTWSVISNASELNNLGFQLTSQGILQGKWNDTQPVSSLDFTVEVTDADKKKDTKTITLNIEAIRILNGNFNIAKGERFSQKLRAEGGSGNYTWMLEDDPGSPLSDKGLKLEGDRIHGTIPASLSLDNFSFTVKATEKSTKKTSQKTFFVQVLNNIVEKCRATFHEYEIGKTMVSGGHWMDNHWGVSANATAQLIRYNITEGRASLSAPGLGLGISFRYYGNTDMRAMPKPNPDGTYDNVDYSKSEEEINTYRELRRIKQNTDCLGTRWNDNITQKAAVHSFSLNPTLFVAKEENESKLALQPAFLVGFFRELLTVGFGVNMTGKDRGDVFMVLGLGSNLDFD